MPRAMRIVHIWLPHFGLPDLIPLTPGDWCYTHSSGYGYVLRYLLRWSLVVTHLEVAEVVLFICSLTGWLPFVMLVTVITHGLRRSFTRLQLVDLFAGDAIYALPPRMVRPVAVTICRLRSSALRWEVPFAVDCGSVVSRLSGAEVLPMAVVIYRLHRGEYRRYVGWEAGSPHGCDCRILIVGKLIYTLDCWFPL